MNPFTIYHKKWRHFRRRVKGLYTRLELIRLMGSRCVHCGEDDPVVLTFDHVKDDGFTERKGERVSVVKKNPERFQLLCHNCNWRKEYWRRKLTAR